MTAAVSSEQKPPLTRQEFLDNRKAAAHDPAEWERRDRELQAHDKRTQRAIDVAEREALEAAAAVEAGKRDHWQTVGNDLAEDTSLMNAATKLDMWADQVGPLFEPFISENNRLQEAVTAICRETARHNEVWLGDYGNMIVDAILQRLSNAGLPIPRLGIDRDARSVADVATVAIRCYRGELAVHGGKKGYT
jgi:hypothetical protein